MPPQIFTLFPTLPCELRQLIWLLTLSGPSKIVPFTPYDSEFFHMPNKAPIDHSPITLQITRESRAIALRHYSTWHNAAAFGFQYVDFNVDTIRFRASDFETAQWNERWTQSKTAMLRLSKADFWRITRVEITFMESEGFGKEVRKWIERWLFTLFPAVKELDVVWACGRTVDERGRSDRDAGEKRVKDEVDLATEWGKDLLEELEGKRGDEWKWKAPALSVRWVEFPEW